ncbi:membrane spanning protein [Rhodococcus pyridinivorans AK37]|uniref:Membrane spanning protein n=4 Tax=Rhodococcus TaxID=1827 RepID=H0JRR5_9NOCA|nr:membrane spanning protein [Rhodococcus pyridinivorans AK37]
MCHSGTMISLILRLIINAVGLWLAVELVDGIDFTDPAGTSDTTRKVISLVVLAAIFTVVNALVKPLVKLLSLPLVILTLGLFLLVVNALMLMLTAWLSGFTEYGLTIDGFWAALWGGVIIAIVNFVLGLVVPDRD